MGVNSPLYNFFNNLTPTIMTQIAKIAESKSKKKVWKARGKNNNPRYIPLEDLEDDHLQKAYYQTQKKELVEYNIMMEVVRRYDQFAEIRKDLEYESIRRGMDLKSVDSEYFENERKHKVQ